MTIAHHLGPWILCGITAGYILWFFGGQVLDAAAGSIARRIRRKK